VLTPNAYLALTSVAFDIPVHPGTAPTHAPNATQAQITEGNRQFKANLDEHRHYHTIVAELRRQLLQAVPPRYVNQLADADFGFTDVSMIAILAHLCDTYGKITPEELEANRARLASVWDPDSSIEALWLRLKECQELAHRGEEDLEDSTAVRLLLSVFEQTGVLATACERWRERDEAEHSMDNFRAHFFKANRERLRKMTIGTAGFHGANAAQSPTPTPPTAPLLRGPTGGSILWYYCHTHGLSTKASHTSSTCRRKGPGHQDAATLDTSWEAVAKSRDMTIARTRRAVPAPLAPTRDPEGSL
jgi:hypothetical protein